MIKKTFRLFYVSYAFVTFVLLMLLAFLAIVLTKILSKQKIFTANFYIIKYWAKAWLKSIGITTTIKNKLYLIQPKQAIIVANHCSYLDIPTFLIACSKPTKILGKIELSRMPIFGTIYKSITITVNRSSQRSRGSSQLALQESISEGYNIFIFPEGGFNETNEPLLPFFEGAFGLSIKNNIPIIPMVFIDTKKRLHHQSIFGINKGQNRVVILSAIYPETVSFDKKILKREVFETMKTALNTA